MLAHLRQRVAATLATASRATLSTSGPAGLQASVVSCAASDIRLYLLLPRTSDHLLNLEQAPGVLVTTAAWQVAGRARVVSAAPRGAVKLLEESDAPWSALVEVQPTRIAIARREGWGAAETIDLE